MRIRIRHGAQLASNNSLEIDAKRKRERRNNCRSRALIAKGIMMKIGLTYDLKSEYKAMGYAEEEIAEFDRDDTIESIEQALSSYGYETDRIGNVHTLVKRLARDERWDLVFNIAEGMWGFGREAQIPALLEAKNIPYTFSDPMMLSLSLHKGLTKRVIHSFGVPTAPFAVVQSIEEIHTVDLPFPLFAKPVAEGTSKGISRKSMIESRDQLVSVCTELLRQFKQPVLIERYLSGREYTVGILGTGDSSRSIGVLEILPNEKAEPYACSYFNKEFCEELISYRAGSDSVARRVEELALKSWRVLGCRDAGRVDFRLDGNGEIFFLEINPLPGLHPTHSDLPILCSLVGFPYQKLIGSIVECALKRYRDAGQVI